jgi:hypothetical protein
MECVYWSAWPSLRSLLIRLQPNGPTQSLPEGRLDGLLWLWRPLRTDSDPPIDAARFAGELPPTISSRSEPLQDNVSRKSEPFLLSVLRTRDSGSWGNGGTRQRRTPRRQAVQTPARWFLPRSKPPQSPWRPSDSASQSWEPARLAVLSSSPSPHWELAGSPCRNRRRPGRRRQSALAPTMSAVAFLKTKLTPVQVFNPLEDDVVAECRKRTNGQGVDVVFDCAGVGHARDATVSLIPARSKRPLRRPSTQSDRKASFLA